MLEILKSAAKHLAFWPETVSRYVPWWKFLWRLIWSVPVQAGRIVMALSGAIGWGLSEARQIWELTR